ncbi:MAG TPA: hypothetical protein ENF22_06480 [Chloroflexi bacterium]|nr:hypothetical protein [Chloroflexota bacterium]
MNNNVSKSNYKYSRKRINVGLGLTIAGFLIFLLGANPDLVGLDRSPYIGFVQTAVFSTGLAMLCLGGYLSFKACQLADSIQSLAQDIGVRLVATGYLISLISGMADVFGFGTQSWPALPFFGPRQAAGVIVGEIIIAIGFILYMPFLSTKA